MRKGFTLIELLAVIVLLGVIVTIITSTVLSTVNKSKESLSDTQISTIEKAASKWVTINADKMLQKTESILMFQLILYQRMDF